MKIGKVVYSADLIAEWMRLPAGSRLLRAYVSLAGELVIVVEHEGLREVDVSYDSEPPFVCPVYSANGFERWER